MSSDMVNKGMAQVFTGLGILLGVGRISSTTHEEIMALLNADQGSNTGSSMGFSTAPNSTIHGQVKRVEMGEIPAGFPRPGKETPVSVQSQDLLEFPDEPVKPAQTLRAQPTQSAPSKETKLICPWWFTEGYSCREHDEGKCPFYHDNIVGGVKHPLICHFWADGGRCTKSDNDCRFAHYPAPHRIRAPMPSKRGSKKLRSSATDDASQVDLMKTSHNDSQDEEEDDEYWHNRGRARPGQEW
ncbi:uncharacterized protein GGS22DRAFT_198158 [Annulohypoxylon maeteangense]|uniref:uncharacterized protein n=1 Tax=Annulohypoxylon maeteangense TaxID=1927788 RepID=UPI002008D972|nr:uncharacterized protein GGS22DRAFT_198158 [Annulohypoxylon maeteangense]KAI0888408.1 hypothetical protein GGS22DRAFT_198158 [Annulohypoxylon maeteangense]